MSDNKLEPGSEKVFLNNIPSPNGNHNGGDLKSGKDELLYVSVGDGGCYYANGSECQYENDASHDRNILLGKVLRIRRDGGIPASNPYTGVNTGRCDQYGHTASGTVARRPSPRASGTPSAWPSTLMPRARASASTTLAGRAGRRSTVE